MYSAKGYLFFRWPRVALARESGQWRLLLSVESAAGDGIFNFQIDPIGKMNLTDLNTQKQIAFRYCPFQRFQDMLMGNDGCLQFVKLLSAGECGKLYEVRLALYDNILIVLNTR